MKKSALMLLAITVLLCLGLFLGSRWNKGVNEKEYQEAITRNLKVFAIDVPDTAMFAGEKAPLDLYYVHEAMDRELLTNVYWHSSTFLMLKRANRYFPVIEKILAQNNIPEDFKYVSLVESSLTNIISPAGATGMWQFIKETGSAYGLEINEEVDERYNLEKASTAACKYFREYYEKYHSWTMAAAAYNAGPENINKPVEIQNTSNFYELLLNPETSRYIYRILAIKEVMNHPVKYGFIFRQRDLYPAIPIKSVEIDSGITNLTNFAKNYGISYKLLKEFNPWLRKNALHNKNKKTYTIQIPDKDFIYYHKLWGLKADTTNAQ